MAAMLSLPGALLRIEDAQNDTYIFKKILMYINDPNCPPLGSDPVCPVRPVYTLVGMIIVILSTQNSTFPPFHWRGCW